ncbi:MAG: ABC transporter permease [Candidatus Omnitrophota bacterium]
MNYKQRIQRLFLNRGILWNIALKELKAKYTGSILGIWWAIVTPFLIMGVITFVFTKIMKVDIVNFPLFCLAGILPWFFFSVSLTESASSLLRNAQLLKQFTFPPEFIPISSVLANFINFIFGLICMIPIFLIFKIKILSFLFFLTIPLILQLLFTLGMAFFLSCINVFFRDLTQLLGVVLMLWFWVTPVFYSVDMVPESYRWICTLNPMATFTTMYRNILFEARIPKLGEVSIALIISVMVFILGYTVFSKYESSFTKRI